MTDSAALSVTAGQREAAILNTAGWLLAMRIDDSEAVRYAFGRRFGSAPVGTVSSERVQALPHEGVMRITLTLTSAHDWDNLRRAGYLEGYPASHRTIFRDHSAQRRRWHKPETIIRAVAVHYLSTAGGGRRTLSAAADTYADRFPGAADDTWQAVRHSRIIKQLEREYGPLP